MSDPILITNAETQIIISNPGNYTFEIIDEQLIFTPKKKIYNRK